MTDNTQNPNPMGGTMPAPTMDGGVAQTPAPATPVVDPAVGQSVPGTSVPQTDTPAMPVATPEPAMPVPGGAPATPVVEPTQGDGTGTPGGGTPPPTV